MTETGGVTRRHGHGVRETFASLRAAIVLGCEDDARYAVRELVVSRLADMTLWRVLCTVAVETVGVADVLLYSLLNSRTARDAFERASVDASPYLEGIVVFMCRCIKSRYVVDMAKYAVAAPPRAAGRPRAVELLAALRAQRAADGARHLAALLHAARSGVDRAWKVIAEAAADSDPRRTIVADMREMYTTFGLTHGYLFIYAAAAYVARDCEAEMDRRATLVAEGTRLLSSTAALTAAYAPDAPRQQLLEPLDAECLAGEPVFPHDVPSDDYDTLVVANFAGTASSSRRAPESASSELFRHAVRVSNQHSRFLRASRERVLVQRDAAVERARAAAGQAPAAPPPPPAKKRGIVVLDTVAPDAQPVKRARGDEQPATPRAAPTSIADAPAGGGDERAPAFYQPVLLRRDGQTRAAWFERHGALVQAVVVGPLDIGACDAYAASYAVRRLLAQPHVLPWPDWWCTLEQPTADQALHAAADVCERLERLAARRDPESGAEVFVDSDECRQQRQQCVPMRAPAAELPDDAGDDVWLSWLCTRVYHHVFGVASASFIHDRRMSRVYAVCERDFMATDDTSPPLLWSDRERLLLGVLGEQLCVQMRTWAATLHASADQSLVQRAERLECLAQTVESSLET